MFMDHAFIRNHWRPAKRFFFFFYSAVQSTSWAGAAKIKLLPQVDIVESPACIAPFACFFSFRGGGGLVLDMRLLVFGLGYSVQ